MVVSGLPNRNEGKHVCQIADMSISLLSKVVNFRIPHRDEEILQLRIGLHTGPCAAGKITI